MRAISKLSKSTIEAVDSQFRIFTSLRPFQSIQQDVQNSLQSNGPLKGTVVAVKDNICTTELPTTCSSAILETYVSPFEASAVSLLKAAGSSIIGKTNMDEFGMGSTGTQSHFGPTVNPTAPSGGPQIVAGGSSSGSAAAVAAGLCDFAVGTDTGGSIRLPAAYCRILGYKPTYGRLSRWGVVAYAQSLDTVGILGKDLNMVKRVFETLDKPDIKDPTCVSQSLRDSIQEKVSKYTPERIRVGVPVELNLREINSEIRQAYSDKLKSLIAAGVEIVPVSIPSVQYALSAYYIIAPAEASSNLAKYDGIRYGTRAPEDEKDGVLYAPTRSAFGAEVKRRILLGTYNLSSEAYKNHFLKAQAVRSSLRAELDSIFSLPNPYGKEYEKSGPKSEGIDFLLLPTAANFPPTLAEAESQSPQTQFASDVMTVLSSLAGLPTINVPLPTDKNSGVQLIGQVGDDDRVLKYAELLL